jgi:hypothetical protein
MTPRGQDPVTSVITDIKANERYADQTEFGGVTLSFSHTLDRLPAAAPGSRTGWRSPATRPASPARGWAGDHRGLPRRDGRAAGLCRGVTSDREGAAPGQDGLPVTARTTAQGAHRAGDRPRRHPRQAAADHRGGDGPGPGRHRPGGKGRRRVLWPAHRRRHHRGGDHRPAPPPGRVIPPPARRYPRRSPSGAGAGSGTPAGTAGAVAGSAADNSKKSRGFGRRQDMVDR